MPEDPNWAIPIAPQKYTATPNQCQQRFRNGQRGLIARKLAFFRPETYFVAAKRALSIQMMSRQGLEEVVTPRGIEPPLPA